MSTGDQIDTVLDELIDLLATVGETEWQQVMSQFRAHNREFATGEQRNQFFSEILRMYGGMGSFSDLVIYPKGKLSVTDNERLDDLRKRLFNLAKQGR